MATVIDVEELRERPHQFLPKLNGTETAQMVEVLQAHHERAVLKLTNAAGLIRFMKLDTDESRHRHEMLGLEILSDCDMAPDIIFADPNRDGLAIVILGEAHGRPLSAQSSQGDWASVARALLEINSLETTALATGSDDDWASHLLGLAMYADGSDLVARAAGRPMQSAAEELIGVQPGPNSLGFIHGDAQPSHFFVGSGGVQAIDLADWTVGDVAFDIAVLSLDDPVRLDELISAFGAGDRASVVARVRLYWRLRLATEIRWFDEHGFDPTELVGRLGSMTSNPGQPR